MALRAIMKRRALDLLNKDLEELRAKQTELTAREKELEEAIQEAETEEERSAVEEEVTTFEQDSEKVNTEISDLERKISGIESELADIEANQKKAAPAADEERTKETTKTETRNTEAMSMKRRNIFENVPMERRTAMFAQEDVQAFMTRVRTAIKEKRAISGAGLLVPPVFLGVIRENILDYSKLLKHVNLATVSGEARQTVMGTIPEAVWTDCCGKLNELDLDFYQESVDCWKVAGYFAVCNANLEDSDIDLASELLTALGYAMGYAIDKAIVFGLGTRMPEGFFTSIAQTSEPADYSADSRPWVDLHTSNIKTIAANKTGKDFFAEFLKATGAAKGKYARGGKVWIMNDTTYTNLKAEAIQADSAGAIVSQLNGTMPVEGGIVEVLDFIPDGMIFGGYLDLYLLAERSGMRLAQSEHVRFLDDQTVFKGTGRYDGKPVIREAFVAIGIGGTTPSAASITFAPDTANTEESE